MTDRKQDQPDTAAMLEAGFGARDIQLLTGAYLSDAIEALIAFRIEQEREQSTKLADALMALLGDTQHAKHPSCTDGGYCPVRDAREALEAFQERIRA